ncbi:hypothetical protein A0256_00720 [Mucilaginibacter sp. PAMC 26640]|nr:hypothetical protein A0256_00720 [Mucilaginibacter sp. PAMC 26640]
MNETDTESVLNASKVALAFNHYAYPKGKQTKDNLEVAFSPELVNKCYLVINFYAFSDKQYKRWYKMDDQEFAVDLTYPNSGILIRRK